MNVAMVVIGTILSSLTIVLAVTVIVVKRKRRSSSLKNKEKILLKFNSGVAANGTLYKIPSQTLLRPYETYILVVSPNEIGEFHQEQYVVLKQGENIFGRDKKKVDFVIKDHYVSKQHFIIRVEGRQLVLVDCESMNGTYLNHNRVDVFPELIKDGDEIQVSHTIFIVQLL